MIIINHMLAEKGTEAEFEDAQNSTTIGQQFCRNVGTYLLQYMVSQPRTQQSQILLFNCIHFSVCLLI